MVSQNEKNEKTENFKSQYDKLSSIASELKTNSELDIDVLLFKVKEAVACHKTCKTRLEVATKELDSILQETNTEEPKKAVSKVEAPIFNNQQEDYQNVDKQLLEERVGQL